MISFSSHHSQLLPVCPHANCLLASAALLPSVCLVPNVFIAESNVPYRVLLCCRGSLSWSHSQTQAVRPHIVPSNHSLIPALHMGHASLLCMQSPIHSHMALLSHGPAFVSPALLMRDWQKCRGMLAVHVHGLTPPAITLQFHTTCRVLKSCSAISSLPILQPISSEFSSGGQGLLEVLGRLGLTVCLRQMKRISF